MKRLFFKLTNRSIIVSTSTSSVPYIYINVSPFKRSSKVLFLRYVFTSCNVENVLSTVAVDIGNMLAMVTRAWIVGNTAGLQNWITPIWSEGDSSVYSLFHFTTHWRYWAWALMPLSFWGWRKILFPSSIPRTYSRVAENNPRKPRLSHP